MLTGLVLLATTLATEPKPRAARALAFRNDPAITHVSAAWELADGRVLISDHQRPAVYVLDPTGGRAAIIGSAGVGAQQYVQPGGFYRGPGGTVLLLDRAQKRVLTIAGGRITGSTSIAVRGTQSSSARDVDLQRVDARGFAYFPETMGFGSVTTTPLLRFEPLHQRSETVTTLKLPDFKEFPGGDGVSFSRRIIGSPADGWGVTPDGRVAVVRAMPYRVEWFGTDGVRIQGPIVEHEAVVMTDADRRAFEVQYPRGTGPSVGMAGAAAQSASSATPFARTKPPFEPEGVMVSPDGRVWVKRNGVLNAPATVYDVFDGAGRRSTRLELPADSDVVGFGASALYVRQRAGGGEALKKYADR